MRIVRTPQGNVEVDETGKKAGRGAYVCANTRCVHSALKTKRLERSLKASVPTEVVEELLRRCAQIEQEEVARS